MVSDTSLPAPDDQHQPLDGCDENLPIRVVYGVLRIGEPLLPSPPAATQPTKPKRCREPRKSGLYTVLHAAQQFGITYPQVGGFLQLPREFDAILALEHKAVAQVVLEVLRQTIGKVDEHGNRQEWAKISQRHFARAGIMSNKDAWHGIEGPLEKGYIRRRKIGARSYEYAIRWRGTN